MGIIKKYTSELAKLSPRALKQKLESNWLEAKEIIRQNGNEAEFVRFINKMFRTSFVNMDQIDKKSKKLIKESEDMELNEGILDFWKYIKKMVVDTFDIKSAFIEKMEELLTTGNVNIGDVKINKGDIARKIEKRLVTDVKKLNMKAVAIYSIMWLILSIGNFFENYVEAKKDKNQKPNKFMGFMNNFFGKLSWLHPATHYRKYKIKFEKGDPHPDDPADYDLNFYVESEKLIHKYLED